MIDESDRPYMSPNERDARAESDRAELERWHTFFHDPDAAVDMLEGLRAQVANLEAALEARDRRKR